MPRKPRLFVEGGVYHVYNRAAHGAAIFGEMGAGEKFVEILSATMHTDGHTVLAWVLLNNHYHVVLRSSAVRLARSFGRVQSSFGRWRNRKLRSKGPTWQSRYMAKLVEDENYLLRLIAYVHLNPVSAGLVPDPAEHRLSGHREILGMSHFGLVARDAVLLLYGDTERVALSSYVSSIGALAESEDWLGANPGRLPWWRHTPDRALQADATEPALAVDGRPFRAPRKELEAEEYLAATCDALEVTRYDLQSRTRRWKVSRTRFMIVGLGIERWAQRPSRLASALGRKPDVISWWAKRATELRATRPDFESRYEQLDGDVRRRFE